MSNRTKLWSVWGALLALLLVGAGSATSRLGWERDDVVHLVFLHTNDVHGQVLPRDATWLDDEGVTVGGIPRVAAFVRRTRRELGRRDADGHPVGVFVVDGGDWYQGTPEGAVDRGLPFARVLGEVGYDAMCVGNHELDHGDENAERLISTARLPAVLANVREPGRGRAPLGAAPWRVVERAGVSVAFVGLLTPATPTITHESARRYTFEDPAEALSRAREAIGREADLIVPLTHLGVLADQELATAHGDLALIVGGHSHTFLRRPIRVGETTIVQAGSKAGAVGRVDLWWDRDERRVVRIESTLHDLYDEPEARDRDPDVERACGRLVERSAARLDEVVGELTAPLEKPGGVESGTAGNWISDLFRARTESNVGIHNRGGIRTRLDAGEVTRRDLFEILPFDNTLVSFDLTGDELFETVRRAVEGRDHSGIEFSGMTAHVAPTPDGGFRLLEVRVEGAALDGDAVYAVATNSFLAGGGDGYFPMRDPRAVRDHRVLLRELLEEELLREGRVTPPSENRYVLVEGR